MNSLVLMLSDLHFGKNTAEGFCMKEGQKRIEGLPEKLSAHPGLFDFEEIVVCLGGDLVEGEDIYPSQNAESKDPAISQVQAATFSLWRMIENLHKIHPSALLRIEMVPGNHGRTSKTSHTASNWDNDIGYHLALKDHAHGPELLQVNHNYQFITTIKVQGFIGMLYHYGVKHLGTPATRIKFVRWCDYYGADFLMQGHWHQAGFVPLDDRWLVRNGSLCGPDDLSDKMAAYDPARQVFFGVHKDHGLHSFNWLQWGD